MVAIEKLLINNKITMKKTLFLVALIFFITNHVIAKDIAIIDLQEIVKGSISFKKFNDSLEKEKNEIQDLIRKKEDELNKKKNDLESKSSILTKDVLQTKIMEFQKEVLAFQDSVKQEEMKLQEKLNNALNILNSNVNEIVVNLLKEEQYSKYSFVSTAAVFIYYDKDNDITMEVLKRLNKQKINLNPDKKK
jgi:Skp family chaperone for outer membrane proteins